MFTQITKTMATVLIVLGILLTAPAFAGDWTFDADAAAGARYDSNVGIAELDENSGEADSIVLVEAGAGLAYTPGGMPLTLGAGYDFSGTSHGQFDLFDLDLHHAVAELQLNTRVADAGLAYDRYEGVLNGEQYVSIRQVTPSVGKLFGSRVYVRAAFMASTRDYELYPERNADQSAGRIDTYLLLDNLDRYISLGVQVSDESAIDEAFNYEGYQVNLAYAHTFDLPMMQLKLKTQLRYEDRDYASETSAIDARRQDQRWRMGLEAEVPFSDYVSLHALFEHTANTSNLDTAVLEKNVAGLELRLAF